MLAVRLYRSHRGVIPANAAQIPHSLPSTPELAHLDCAGSVAFWEFWLCPTAGLSWYETENQTDNPMTQLLGATSPPVRRHRPLLVHRTGFSAAAASPLHRPPLPPPHPPAPASLSWIIQNSWMEPHSDCTSHLFQDEDRRMAGVQTRKEEEKKRESQKQTIHKVPLSDDLTLLYLSACKWNLKLMNTEACIPDSVWTPRLPTALSWGGCCTDKTGTFLSSSYVQRCPASPSLHSETAIQTDSYMCVCVCVCNLQVISVNSERCILVHGQFLFTSCVSMHVAFCECALRSSSCGDSGCSCAQRRVQ